ncbi:XRE family transcriptional regulator [Streptomyces sp. NPDC049881]|uniref:helix-turn-helix domain-containing protein n=1 Tax=Streptomyces sp. NPDC049881 TaxID=3155778 RepID=UPI0034301FE3
MDLNATIAASIRRERARAGLTLTELARRARLAKSTLSQLESGGGNPSVETLWALALALDVPFSHLVDPPAPPVRLVRAGEGDAHHAEDADYAATLLAAGPAHVRRDLYRIAAEPGDSHLSPPHRTGTVEHLVLATGRAEAGPSDDPVELAPGDYLAYPGDGPHLFRALAPGTTAVIVMEHP